LKVEKKPYYLRQPWDILFKESKLEKISPWSIDLVLLLSTLLQEMEKAGIDFRLAGTALNSSVLIYLKKAEMLLKMEELPKTPEERPISYIPPALPLPFRFEHTTTTVNDLIEALEKALTERSRSPLPKLPSLPSPIPDFLEVEQYLLEIESRSDELYDNILTLYKEKGAIKLTEIAYGLEWFEIVRMFMMLLFLAQRLRIELQQPEDEIDIIISLPEDEE
jgi:chromatin segregation and condensation protein Rec8/ScpA/Scc1 (kleisin family)